MSRDDDLRELDEAVEELIQETRRLAWQPNPHDTTDDTVTVADAADQLNRRLEH